MILKVPGFAGVSLGLVGGLAVWAAAGQAPAVPATPAEAHRITAEELKALAEKGQAVIVDVRAKEAWDAGHIEGAVHIPLAELSSRLKDLPKNKHVVAYCT